MIFQKGNRLDLVEQEQSEIKILTSYFPETWTEVQIETEIRNILRERNMDSASINQGNIG